MRDDILTKEDYMGRQKGYKVSDTTKKNMSKSKLGNIPWNKGIPMTQELKDKIIKTVKESETKHHKYGNRNSDITIKIPSMLHPKIHSYLFDYLYTKYGKKELDCYYEWLIFKGILKKENLEVSNGK